MVTTAEETTKSSASIDIRQLYANMREERREYLDEADKVASLTITDLRPTGRAHTSLPYTHIGTTNVESLAAVLHHVVMPQVKWYEFGVDAAQLIGQGLDTPPAEMEEALTILQNQMARILDQTRARQLNIGLMESLIVEQLNLVVIDEPEKEGEAPSLRVFPLRSFCIERISGIEHRVVLREEDYDAADRANEYAAGNPGEEGDIEIQSDENAIFTLIDYGEGKVYQQSGNESKGKLIEGRHPDQYVVFTTRVPFDSSYLTGYAHRYYGTMHIANELTKGLKEGALLANWAVLLVMAGADPGFVNELEKIKPGEVATIPVSDLETGAKFLTVGAKISDWSFVGAYIEKLEQTLDRAFAAGIAKRKPKTRTAAEVTAIREELETQVTLMADTISDGWRRVLLGIMRVMKMGLVMRDGKAIPMSELKDDEQMSADENLIQPVVVTGMTAINRESQLRLALEGIAMIAQVDGTVLERLDGLALLRRWMNNIGFDIDSAMKEAQDQGGAGMTEDQMAIAQKVQSGEMSREEGVQALKQFDQVNNATAGAAGQAAREAADGPAL